MDDPPPASPRTPPDCPPASVATPLAALWIWTVFFGLNGSLSYSFLAAIRDLTQIGLMGTGRGLPGSLYVVPLYGLNSTILPALFGAGLVASVGAWLSLYLYFVTFVLPVVFLQVAGPHEDRRLRLAAGYLNRTYQLLILAGLARATPEVLYLVLPALGNLGIR